MMISPIDKTTFEEVSLRIIERLYQLEQLQRRTITRNRAGTEQEDSSKQLFRWRRCIRDLCDVCQLKRPCQGGTIAMMVTVESGHNIFHLATNSQSNSDTKEANYLTKVGVHLKRVLELLHTSRSSPAAQHEHFRGEIARECIALAKSRVREYLRRLRATMRCLSKTTSDIDSCTPAEAGARIQLHSDSASRRIGEILSVGDDHLKACTMAYELLRNENCHLADVLQRAQPDQRDLWLRAQHFLGRLALWHSCARRLVKYAQVSTPLWSPFKINTVPCRDRPFSCRDIQIDIAQLNLVDHDDADDGDELMGPFVAATRAMRKKDILRIDQSNIKIHAEMILLHYALRAGYEFANGDRFIGTSKPPCYSCHSFIMNHPCRFVVNRSHGNVWYNWAFPLVAEHDKSYADVLQSLQTLLTETIKTIDAHEAGDTTATRRQHETETGLSQIMTSSRGTSWCEVLEQASASAACD